MVEFAREVLAALLNLTNDQLLSPTLSTGLAIFVAVISYFVSPALAAYAFWLNRSTFRRLQRRTAKYFDLRRRTLAAQKESQKLEHRLETARQEVRVERDRIKHLQDDLRTITKGTDKLWNLRGNQRFAEYDAWARNPKGAKIVTVGHLKGGVGKTTLAANLAAYYAEHFRKSVLIIDLDYQASLSNALTLAAEIQAVGSRVDRLFDPQGDLATVNANRIHPTPIMNRGWLIPSDYQFAETDSRLLMQWLLPADGSNGDAVDVRYRLAHVLLKPQVREDYGMIILDMPPRLTVGAVNALVASDYIVIPTILDKLSTEAVPRFLRMLRELKEDLQIDLEVAGVVPTMTQYATHLLGREASARDDLEWQSRDAWGESAKLTDGWIARRVHIAGAIGQTVAYNLPGADGNAVRAIFDPVFAELCHNMGLKPPESHIRHGVETDAQMITEHVAETED